jgi:UDPglucose 6-dehydrogenase
MRIAVIGAGHVGTVCGACLSALDHDVTVIDVNEERIAALRAGRTPFVEPGLAELIGRGRDRGNLTFSIDDDDLATSEVVFLCVNTDNTPGGSVDLGPLEAAVGRVARAAGGSTILVNRSTAPVGTAEYVRALTEELRGAPMDVAVNPEFLAEGTAVRDFLAPDRILVGAFEETSAEALRRIYRPILERRLPEDTAALAGPAVRDEIPFLVTDPASAELAKYAANSMLAVKISFINEIAEFAEELGADVTKVAEAVGLDRRIGAHFLRAGIGWGGSCFPKDIVALQGIAQTRGLSARILRAAHDVNADQRTWAIRRLQASFKTLFGRRVGLLGLAFKPNTDDLRSAPALEIAEQLALANVHVRAFDPVVKTVPGYEDTIEIADDLVSLATGADALIVVTEWPEFREMDLATLRDVMRTPLILDGRNALDPEAVRAAGFAYLGVGRAAPGVLATAPDGSAAPKIEPVGVAAADEDR